MNQEQQQLGDLLAITAYGFTLAEHSKPRCECKVKTGFEPVSKTGGIRDCYWMSVDTNGCPIHAGTLGAT